MAIERSLYMLFVLSFYALHDTALETPAITPGPLRRIDGVYNGVLLGWMSVRSLAYP
jgi:hypothetical protein